VRNKRGSGLTGFRRYTWWAVPGSTAFVLVLFTGEWILDPDVRLWARAAGLAALAVTVPATVVLLGRRISGDQMPAGWLICGSLGAVVLSVVPLALRNYGLWPIAPAIMVAIVATFLPLPRRRVLIVASTVLATLPGGVVGLLSGDGGLHAWLFPPGLFAFTAWMVLGPLWAWDVAERLEEARTLSAELAVKDERLRFAAELHDIQGHHLQVIALKSELAARLATADPARAATEMNDVRRLAAEALQDTRAVVNGYRNTTLDGEIVNATRVLAAADIDARMNLEPTATGRLTETGRRLLGLVMREATTNVLRHSTARHVDVDYRVTGGRVRLRVSNDGVADHAASAAGSGLHGLAERLGTAGGELTWERDSEHFMITASLPAGSESR
jgi:two-component system, NarL family, sensor histidine kinase DesK